MTDAQGWSLLGLVGVLLGVIGSLVVQQVRDRLDACIHGLETTFDARLAGFQVSVDARFDAVDRGFDHLDRDVRARLRDRFRREE
ncbi:MAG: hypothetical protein ABI807_15315 [Sporichthyaceae bacterium]